jgi:protoporphyrinogen oxidase
VSQRIVIVGGGFTGLVAARELLKRKPDLRVTIVERAPNLGGLAAGFELCGTSLEKTYHYLFLTDSEILDLARELGVGDRIFWGNSTVGIYLGGRIFPFNTPLDLLRFSPCNLAGRVRLGMAMLYLQKTRDWKPFVRRTAHDWLSKACGSSAMQTMWQPLLNGKFADAANQVSMAWFWARVHARMNSRKSGGEKLGYFRGGFAVVVDALERELRQAGVQFRIGASVEAIESGPGEQIVRVDGERLPFDRCLFTGPSAALAKLLPAQSLDAAYRRQLDSIGYLGAVCLIFATRQSLAEQFWVNMNEPGAPFLVFVQHSQLTGTEAYQGRNVYYLGTYLPQNSAVLREEESALASRWFAYLKKMFPEFDARQVEAQHLFRFNAAQHIVDTEYESKIPACRTPVPGVYLSNFSQIFPEDRGTNFAVREGRRVARLMLDDLTS